MEIEKLKDTFKGRKVFITGHTGFKGTWLLHLLHLFGANIKGYALPPENEQDIYNLTHGDELCESVFGDIKDPEQLKNELIRFEPDFIFHLAAQPLVRLSYETPVNTFMVNAQGSVHLLDALRFLKKACVCVMITTDKVYFNLESGKLYAESDRLGGYDPYSASKACAELVIDSYRNSFFNITHYPAHQKSVSVARAGNVIGGGDWSKDRIIPDVVRSLQSGKPVHVRNPDAVRPWQHVLDPLLGYIMLAAKQFNEPEAFAQAFNFGPEENDVLPVSGLVERSIAGWGEGSFEAAGHQGQPHEAGLLHLDISKAKKSLGWKPAMNSSQAINYTMEWYKEVLSRKTPARQFTIQQINNYLNTQYEQ